jgi:transposase, IS5 family
MSIDQSGLATQTTAQAVVVEIKKQHPLMKLSNILSWDKLATIVLPDLKATTKKGKWWMGRPLRLRIHLGAYLLQQLKCLTDREAEYQIKDNAAYQLFCGQGIVKQWHYPDHTKIEGFRSRLSAETQKQLANELASQAVSLGFADASHIDIDSTVQEANMRYPTDSSLLCKLGGIAKVVAGYMNEKLQCFAIKPMYVNLKRIKSMARRCFFLKKNAEKEERSSKLQDLLTCVSEEIRLVISNARCMGQQFIEESPWNIRRAFYQLIEKGNKYLSDVSLFIKTGSMVKNKILSFHLDQVRCIAKNKPGKKYQFGRIVQLARIKGNFLFAGKCDVPNQADKKSVQLMLDEHAKTFSDKTIHSAATDKGYYSLKNVKIMAAHGVKEIGIQRPSNLKSETPHALPRYREDELIDRRAGVEPLIGHAKNRSQLDRSRMKSDQTIEASGFAAILGFNLRQLVRCNREKMKMEAT